VNTFIAEVRRTVLPIRGGNEGPLPPLLVTLTFVTGLVDAFSYLVLGHVFVANMTGNVVFLGFALAGAPGFSIGASVVALALFWLGALLGGRVGRGYEGQRGQLLSTATGIQGVFIVGAVILAALSGSPVTSGYRYALIACLAVAMGVQNAAARQIAVPDLTTTVLTLTIVGSAADSAVAGGKGSKSGRRLVAVIAMLVGALVGAALVLHVHIVFALVVALVALSTVAIIGWTVARSDHWWAEP